MQCLNNLRQLGLAAHNFESQFGRFPPGYIGEWPVKPSMDAAFNSYIGHLVFLLPFLEGQAYYRPYSQKRELNIDICAKVPNDPRFTRWSNGAYPNGDSLWVDHQVDVAVFLCPSDDAASNDSSTVTELRTSSISGVLHGFTEPTSLGRTNYLGSAGRLGVGVPSRDPEKGIFYNRSKTRFRDITDGTSNTLMFGEVTGSFENGRTASKRLRSLSWNAGPQWTEWHRSVYPYAGERRVEKFSSMHNGVIHFALADGSARSLSVEGNLLVELSSIAYGELAQASE